MTEDQILALRQALQRAERVTVLTGAGISAESGVPTFRGADGLRENYNVMDLATPEVMITIGTSAVVQPAASLAMEAKRSGALTAEINLERTDNSGFMDFVLQGKAGETVPGLPDGRP